MMKSSIYLRLTAVLYVTLLNACGEGGVDSIATPETATLSKVASVGYIYHAENGNRYAKGNSDLSNTTPIDIPLPATVTYIAAAANGAESIWTTVLANGVVKAFKVDETGYDEVSITPAQLSTPVPPTLVVGDDNSVKLGNVFAGASIHSAAVIVNKTNGDRAYIADNGDVVLKTAVGEQRLAVGALLYARLLLDANGRILVLTKPSTRYDHVDVLGSQHPHASSITLVETHPIFQVVKTIDIPSPDVVEGNALMWEDVNNDGQLEIITTLSKSGEGARIVVYNEDGAVVSSSSAIGVDHRWRHQIAVAPFQSAGENSLVSIYIPHLGPNIEYFRLDNASMTRSAKAVDFSSHLYTGANIDMSITGDFDNDGKIELLLINRNTRKEIGAFEYQDSGIVLDWRLPLSAAITSNLAAVTLTDNRLALGVGQGTALRVWRP